MSVQNVELVRAMQPTPDVDLAKLFRDEGALEALIEIQRQVLGSEHLAGEDFRSRMIMLGPGEWRLGPEGLRQNWQDWLEPWASYRGEIRELIDCGDDVLVLTEDFGVRHDGTEVKLLGAAVWTVRDGRVMAAQFFGERRLAYEAVGLEAPELRPSG